MAFYVLQRRRRLAQFLNDDSSVNKEYVLVGSHRICKTIRMFLLDVYNEWMIINVTECSLNVTERSLSATERSLNATECSLNVP
jgi:hypothetical protein